MRVSLSKYTIENVRAILRLDPKVQTLFLEFLWRISMARVYIRITDSTRTEIEQNKQWISGNSAVNDHNSYHTHALAIDIAPLTRIGPIYYKTWYTSTAFEKITKIARSIGIVHPHEDGTAETNYKPWRDLGYHDQPHYQWSGGLSIQDLKDGNPIPEPQFEVSKKTQVLDRAIVRALSRV